MSTTKLGDKLRRLRTDKKLPLRKVAAMLDIDVAILSKMERGERKLTKEVVLKLAEIYGHDPDELVVMLIAEKVIYEIENEELAIEGLLAAEEEIKYRTQPVNPTTHLSKQNLMTKLGDYFKTQNKVSKAWLFGSFARGDNSLTSDIDIVIKVSPDQKFTLFDLAEIQEQLQSISGKKTDVVMLDGLRPEMKTRILKDMILLYETR